MFDSRCCMYFGINIIVYILLIFYEKYFFILYFRGFIIFLGVEGDLYIKIVNSFFCKIKNVG